jgi:hypothetical protein
MQIGSGSNSTSRAKAAAKTKRGKAAPPETIHLKAKKRTKAPGTTPGDLASMIATAAYYRAAQRGFEPGHELEDWLEAEHQVRSHLSS